MPKPGLDVVEEAYHIQYTNQDPDQVIELIEQDLPRFMSLFISKSREYGDSNKFVLGSRGQFADMWRKFGKLKTGMWEGKEDQLTSESVDEILLDLIGHCFLTLQCRRAEATTDFDTAEEGKAEIDLDVLKSTVPAYEHWSSEALFLELGRRHLSLPRAVAQALTAEQVIGILYQGDTNGTQRDWDRIVSAESRAYDGQPNYELAGEDDK